MKELSGGMERLVDDTMQSLAARGIDAADLAPLMKLRRAVRALEGVADLGATPARTSQAVPATGTSPNKDSRLGHVEASEGVLARASAIIDVLVQSGHAADHAAQLVTRQLLSVGINLPEAGGDARAWKRFYNWRNTLIHYKRSGPAWDAYCAFRDELASIPASQRLRRVVSERLWDRRRERTPDQNSA